MWISEGPCKVPQVSVKTGGRTPHTQRNRKTYDDVPAPAVVRPLVRVLDHQGVPRRQVGRRRGCETEYSTVPEPSEKRTHSARERGVRLDREHRLDDMGRLDDDAERRPTPAAKCEEQVLILALVRGTEDAVGGNDLHLDLVVDRAQKRWINGNINERVMVIVN